jgi:acetyl esterase
MNKSVNILLVSLLLLSACKPQVQISRGNYTYQPDEVVTYKTVDTTDLKLEVILPEGRASAKLHPAIVFFFGGGWVSGTTSQFAPQAQHFAKKGYVTFLADYRVKSRNQTTPFESLMDAKSAMRYVKGHAARFGVDSSRVIACGGSAGGHLAAATALVSGYNDPQDDLAVSPVPEALVLFNPVIDNGPGGYGYDRIGKAYPLFSPMENIRRKAPPTLLMIGSEDQLIPLKTVEKFKSRMDSVGSYCKVKVYPGQNHGFFNYWFPDNYRKTLKAMDRFLAGLRKR